MTRHSLLTVGGLAFIVAFVLGTGVASAQKKEDIAAAAKASPDLVAALQKEMTGATPEQAAGAAGAMFGLAKSKLKPAEFSQLSAAVPGMDALLKAAPGGGAKSLSGMAGAFSKIGLKPEMVKAAAPFLTQYVSKLAGPQVGGLLASVLK